MLKSVNLAALEAEYAQEQAAPKPEPVMESVTAVQQAKPRKAGGRKKVAALLAPDAPAISVAKAAVKTESKSVAKPATKVAAKSVVKSASKVVKAAAKPAAKKAAAPAPAPAAAEAAAPVAQTRLAPQAAWPFPTGNKP